MGSPGDRVAAPLVQLVRLIVGAARAAEPLLRFVGHATGSSAPGPKMAAPWRSDEHCCIQTFKQCLIRLRVTSNNKACAEKQRKDGRRSKRRLGLLASRRGAAEIGRVPPSACGTMCQMHRALGRSSAEDQAHIELARIVDAMRTIPHSLAFVSC
jgi:hypothetical protein